MINKKEGGRERQREIKEGGDIKCEKEREKESEKEREREKEREKVRETERK